MNWKGVCFIYLWFKNWLSLVRRPLLWTRGPSQLFTHTHLHRVRVHHILLQAGAVIRSLDPGPACSVWRIVNRQDLASFSGRGSVRRQRVNVRWWKTESLRVAGHSHVSPRRRLRLKIFQPRPCVYSAGEHIYCIFCGFMRGVSLCEWLLCESVRCVCIFLKC